MRHTWGRGFQVGAENQHFCPIGPEYTSSIYFTNFPLLSSLLFLPSRRNDVISPLFFLFLFLAFLAFPRFLESRRIKKKRKKRNERQRNKIANKGIEILIDENLPCDILSSLSLSLIRRFFLVKSFARAALGSHSCAHVSLFPFLLFLCSLLSLSLFFSTRGYLCSRFTLIFFLSRQFPRSLPSFHLSFLLRTTRSVELSVPPRRLLGFFADLPPPDTRGRG